MKRHIYSILAVLTIVCAASCEKEQAQLSSDLTFTANLEENDTKTALSGSNVIWNNNDEVAINGVAYIATPSTPATKASLSKKTTSDPDPSGPYTAYYPASIYNGGIPTLPAVQTYESGKISNIPMYATSSTKVLTFKNICAVLAVKVVSGTVNDIRIISDDNPLSGVFIVNGDDKAVIGYPCSNQVIMQCGGIEANNTVFHIAVPAGTYGHLQIVINEGATEQTMTTTKAGGVTLERNKLYSMTFTSGTTPKYHAWVQFTSEGLKWATMNLGATKERGEEETSWGTHYRYGSLTKTGNQLEYPSGHTGAFDISGKFFNADGTENPLGEYGDVVRKEWGGDWRIPTYDECVAVFGNNGTTTGYHKVLSGTPSKEYDIIPGFYVFYPKTIPNPTYDSTIDPHIFMPLSSYNNTYQDKGTYGHWWTSTMSDSGTHTRIFGNGVGVGRPIYVNNWLYGSTKYLFAYRPVKD